MDGREIYVYESAYSCCYMCAGDKSHLSRVQGCMKALTTLPELEVAICLEHMSISPAHIPGQILYHCCCGCCCCTCCLYYVLVLCSIVWSVTLPLFLLLYAIEASLRDFPCPCSFSANRQAALEKRCYSNLDARLFCITPPRLVEHSNRVLNVCQLLFFNPQAFATSPHVPMTTPYSAI